MTVAYHVLYMKPFFINSYVLLSYLYFIFLERHFLGFRFSALFNKIYVLVLVNLAIARMIYSYFKMIKS